MMTQTSSKQVEFLTQKSFALFLRNRCACFVLKGLSRETYETTDPILRFMHLQPKSQVSTHESLISNKTIAQTPTPPKRCDSQNNPNPYLFHAARLTSFGDALVGAIAVLGLSGVYDALPKATAPDMIALAKATVLAVDHLF
jgi:hypothetical protein